MIISARLGRKRCIAGFTAAAALLLSMFMASFLTEFFEHDAISALAPATVYGVISLLFLTRARLAWIGRGRRNYGFGG